jgi:hypothetical protein
LLNLAALVGPLASLDGIGGCYRVHGRNWFAHSAGVQLGQIRHTITVTAATHEEIRQLASRRGLARGDLLRLSSVTDLAQRLISLRLEPELHPFPGDWRARLAWQGIVTTLRRSDLSRRRRALYAAWFAAMAVLPSPAPAWLAERLFEAWRLGNIAIPLPKG